MSISRYPSTCRNSSPRHSLGDHIFRSFGSANFSSSVGLKADAEINAHILASLMSVTDIAASAALSAITVPGLAPKILSAHRCRPAASMTSLIAKTQSAQHLSSRPQPSGPVKGKFRSSPACIGLFTRPPSCVSSTSSTSDGRSASIAPAMPAITREPPERTTMRST